jgi:hypothetical protein
MRMRLAGLAGLALVMCVSPAPAQESGPGRVLARVHGVEITAGDLARRLELLARERAVPPERHGEVLRGLIREELLMRAIGTAGLERDPAVQARVETARRQVLIDEFLRRAMASAGEVGEDELQQAYRENALRFLVETTEVSHIMVATAAEAEAVRKELLAGKDFADMARARSQDEGSADKGGTLGPITMGQTVPEFDAAAFRLKDGELSDVVQTEQGYHILKGGPRGTALRPFEEVREELRQTLVQGKQQEVLRKVLAELEQQGGVEILDERLK